MTRKIIHPNPASAATSKVVGPAPALKVVGPAPSAKVVGPNRARSGSGAPYRVNGKVVGPATAALPKVVGPTASAAVTVARPAPGANVVGPRPGVSGARAPAAPGAVVRQAPAAKVVGPGARPANGHNGNGHNGNGNGNGNGHGRNGTGNGTGTGTGAGAGAASRRTALAPKDRWLRVGEVAERFGVGPRTVKQWARKGRLPAIRTLGGHYRFPESAINEQLQAGVPTAIGAGAETQDRLLRPGEVAELFGVDQRPVGRWAKQGRLPAVRTIGGHYRFPEAAVRALLWRLSPAERSALELLEAGQGHADTWPVSQSVARALAGRGLVVIDEAQASITKAGRQALAAARQAQIERARVARP